MVRICIYYDSFQDCIQTFYWVPVCVLRFCYLWFPYDVCACLCPVLQEHCSPLLCEQQSVACRALIRVFWRIWVAAPSRTSLKSKVLGFGGFLWSILTTNLLNNNTHEVVQNDPPCEESPLASQMPKQTKGIWHWAARFQDFLGKFVSGCFWGRKQFWAKLKILRPKNSGLPFEATT